MQTIATPLHANAPPTPGELLVSAIEEQRPLVLILGQDASGESQNDNSVLASALDRLGRNGRLRSGWSALLGAEAVPGEFYDWLAERFARRVHPRALEVLSELPWSAVFTSSLDPTLMDLFRGPAREPAVVLTGEEIPPAVRSKARPPLYYLFSRAGEHDPQALPPRSRSELNRRRIGHAVPLLRRVTDTATVLGLIVVEGFSSGDDCFRLDDLLGIIGNAAPNQVLWFGGRPPLRNGLEIEFDEAVESDRILVEPRRLGTLVAELRERDRLSPYAPPDQEDAGTISLDNGRFLETTPEQRLRIEAVASIVDDSWTAFLPPLGKDTEYTVFRRFHGNLQGPRLLVEGVRRGFAIQRDFEHDLWRQIASTLADHSSTDMPIVLEGQSGSGKSVALARAVARARDDEKLPVLYSIDRVPASHDVVEFCEAAERAGAKVTLIVCDANRDLDPYHDLLTGLRSRGRRVVVVGSRYRSDASTSDLSSNGVEATVFMSKHEEDELANLVEHYVGPSDRAMERPEHILAFLYQLLPASRPRIGAGLSAEARSTERGLRSAGRQTEKVRPITLLHQRMIEAGVVSGYRPLLQECGAESPAEEGDAAELVIDYVMIAGSLNCPVPINLVIRAVTGRRPDLDVSSIGHLFRNLDLFRWRKSVDRDGEEVYVAPRLTLEAELLCKHRFGGAESEAYRLLGLIQAVRGGAHDSGEVEIRFLLDLLRQVGPEGLRGRRYVHSYVAIARALTELRERYGVVDARLILQEAAFRRSAVRYRGLDHGLRLSLLEEARDVDQYALDGIADGTVYATRRTKDSLLVERAAIYGFLARNLAEGDGKADEVWAAYRAARRAVHVAGSATDDYYPYDVGLWTPSDLIECAGLSETRRAELACDIYSTLDQVDVKTLSPKQRERYHSRRIIVGNRLRDQRLTDDAYAELETAGSTAGYYLRARDYVRDLDRESTAVVDGEAQAAAHRAAAFLSERFGKVKNDYRCLLLLLECRWIVEVGRWPLRGERQPLPVGDHTRREFLDIIQVLNHASGGAARHVPRYLEAVLTWLADEATALEMFRGLAQDTDHEFAGRVVRRHMITDTSGAPCRFGGRVERQRGDGHWVVRVDGLDRAVNLLSRDFPHENLAYGRTVSGFGVAFNFIGPIADAVR